MDYMTVAEIADAFGVSAGRVRQIIGADPTFPRPAERAALGRTRRWDSRQVQRWADQNGRILRTQRPPVGEGFWEPPESPPIYAGYSLVAGYDVMKFATADRVVALAQRRSRGGQTAPSPTAVNADVVVAMDEFDLDGDVITRIGERGRVGRDVLAQWVSGRDSPGRVPWWDPYLVTPQMLATWRPGDPLLPVTIAKETTDALWRLLADADPKVVAFARYRLAQDLPSDIGPPPTVDGAESIHARAIGLNPVPTENVIIPVVEDSTEEDYPRVHRNAVAGAMAVLGRRDAAAMNPDIARSACNMALESAAHATDSLTEADFRRLVSQWEPVTATAAHWALLPHPSKDVTAEFYHDPWLDAPAVVTRTDVVVAARRFDPLPHLEIATVALPGSGTCPVITATDGRVYLTPEHIACGYRGSGPALTHHLLALIHGDRRPAHMSGDYGQLRQTALAEYLESEEARKPGAVLTGAQVRDLADRPGWIASDPL